ncbi:MAG: hypothetical protein ACREBW_10425 [Candidatus Micrarchaeaceae archaeon]
MSENNKRPTYFSYDWSESGVVTVTSKTEGVPSIVVDTSKFATTTRLDATCNGVVAKLRQDAQKGSTAASKHALMTAGAEELRNGTWSPGERAGGYRLEADLLQAICRVKKLDETAARELFISACTAAGVNVSTALANKPAYARALAEIASERAKALSKAPVSKDTTLSAFD